MKKSTLIKIKKLQKKGLISPESAKIKINKLKKAEERAKISEEKLKEDLMDYSMEDLENLFAFN